MPFVLDSALFFHLCQTDGFLLQSGYWMKVHVCLIDDSCKYPNFLTFCLGCWVIYNVSVDTMALLVADVDPCVSQSRLTEFIAVVWRLFEEGTLARCHAGLYISYQIRFQLSKEILKAAHAMFLVKNFLWDHHIKTFANLLMDFMHQITMFQCPVCVCVEYLFFNITCWNSTCSKPLKFGLKDFYLFS